MMALSRFWYAVLAVFTCAAIYAVMVAVGQYNRASVKGTNDALAADAITVRWAIQIDSRRRIDALINLSLDKGIQDAVIGANDKDKIPTKSREEARKAIATLQEKIAAPVRPDAVFILDHDGRVVAQAGYPASEKFDDFELGGYSSVNDALHGWLRDDTWVWNGQIYRVAARPVEYDPQQPPIGAVVGIRAFDRVYVQNLVKDTQANVVFFSQGQRAAGGGVQGFDEGTFDLILPTLGKLDDDPTYKDKGHTDIVDISPGLGAVFAKLDGDAYEMGTGFAVMRTRAIIPGGWTFLGGADETDRKNVSWAALAGVLLGAFAIGFGLTFLEHDAPLRRMRRQAAKLKKGDIDVLQLPQLSGPLRDIGADINAGIERVAEKGGGAPRKPADLEAIVGPVPNEPAMSAFAFPMPEAAPPPPVPPAPPARTSNAGAPPPPSNQKPPPPLVPQHTNGGTKLVGSVPVTTKPALPAPVLQQPVTTPTTVMPARDAPVPMAPRPNPPMQQPSPPVPPAIAQTATPVQTRHADEEEATMVGAVPREVMERALGENPEEADWPQVYEEFVRTKKQCSEPVEGLTFDKFRLTLRKNRDALVQRHNCKRVKFTVYVKDGRASLKATPIKD